MTFLSNNIFADNRLLRRIVQLKRLSPLLLLLCTGVQAGERTWTSYASGYQSSNVFAADSLTLAPADTTWAKIWGDSLLRTGTNPTRSPSVQPVDADRFTFYWSDSSSFGAAKEDVYKKDVVLNSAGAAGQSASQVYYDGAYRITYLHSVTGATQQSVSFLDNSFATLHVTSGVHTLDIIANVTPIGSLCHLRNDTLLVTYRVNNTELRIRKVVPSGSGIATISDHLVATASGAGSDILFNSSIVADSNSTVVLLFTRGANVDNNRKLEYKVMDASLATLDSGQVSTDIGDPTGFFYYDDAPIVDLRKNKFVAVSWNTAGIRAYEMDWTGSALQIQTTRLLSGAPFRSANIATNGKQLVIAWKGDINGDGRTAAEGFVYDVGGGTIDFGARDTFIFSDPSVDIPTDAPVDAVLALGIDTLGSLAVAWPGERYATAAIWAIRPVLHAQGSWISGVDSLMLAAGDSVRITRSAIMTANSQYGSVRDSIRIGSVSDPADAANWQAFANLDAGVEVEVPASAAPIYFQIKLALDRNNVDSLRTPIVRQNGIAWNTKPRFSSLDTVQNGDMFIAPGIFGDTIDLQARSDSAYLVYTLQDADSGDSVFVSAHITASRIDTVVADVNYQSSTVAGPFSAVDTVYTCLLTSEDERGWESRPAVVYLQTYNSPPHIIVRAVWDSSLTGSRDTAAVVGQRSISIQNTDSLEVLYELSDSNDADVRAYLLVNESPVDSIGPGQIGDYTVRAAQVASSGFHDIKLRCTDPDTTVEHRIVFGVNYPPEFRSVSAGQIPVADGDSLAVRLFNPLTFDVGVFDSNLASWDSLTYRFATPRFDSAQAGSLFTFTPAQRDSSLVIYLSDFFGQTDSMRIKLAYPWMSIDSQTNPVYAARKDSLSGGFPVIARSPAQDTMILPVFNSGTRVLNITGLAFAGDTGGWLSVGIEQDNALVFFNSLDMSYPLQPVAIAAGDTHAISIVVRGDGMQGDGFMRDTLIIATDDPVHPFDTLPVLLEYNDLPIITYVAFEFDMSKPYWLSKQSSTAQAQHYVFPPHAQVSLFFSEPIAPASVNGALRVYSVLDSVATGQANDFQLNTSWSNNNRKLTITPTYTQPSQAFGGLLPPPGSYIPTDSIAFIITSGITDAATTPSGPNALDVNQDYLRDANADTMIAVRVDSIKFMLQQTSPAAGDSTMPGRPVSLVFSAPVFDGSIDASFVNNRSLLVTSLLNNWAPVAFSSVNVSGATAVFRPAITFYYGDSIACVYRAATGRDTLGYPADANNDGIPINLFDSTAQTDDVRWAFTIQDIGLVDVTPDSASSIADIHTPISLTFNGPVFAGMADMRNMANNTTLHVKSKYGEGLPALFRTITLSEDSLTLTFQPDSAFFSKDSVSCIFWGFPRTVNYASPQQLPDTIHNGMAAYEWFFYTRNVSFYTYPNPYKPGADTRHCGNPGAPCGIWFKNLHSLYPQGGNEVAVVILSIKGHPLFDTRAAGDAIRFRPGSGELRPQWKWNTANQKGDLVASGLYFYIVYDPAGNALAKGKLMIVR
ncbi:MAG: hypothetical protein GF398_07400 [Chitinivibrionales bacterium]|nr:hypothetical protein [Chitinivibrionales bacterium]